MPEAIQVTVQLVDANGDKAQSQFFAKDDASDAEILEIVDQIQGISALKVTSWSKVTQHAYAPLAGRPLAFPANPYADDKYRLEMIFSSDSPRHNLKMGVPGPRADYIEFDDGAINPANGDMADFRAAMLAAGATSHNDAATALLKGKLFKRN